MSFAALTLAIGSFAVVGIPETNGDVFRPVALDAVHVDGEIGRRIDVTVDNNLMVLDADKDFLEPFRARRATGGYVGLGKLIDALVRFAVYTGDEKVLARKEKVVADIIALQEEDGYLGQFRAESRLWKLWDIHEIAYLIQGLMADYRYFDAQDSLAAARKAADYIVEAWLAKPEAVPGGGEITTYMAVTGLETALLSLYEATGEDAYMDFCVEARKLPAWDGAIVKGRWGTIQGHVYAYISRCLSQVALNRLTPDTALLANSRKANVFMLAQGGLSVTGTAGQHECWHDTQEGAANLGETCATAYLIRFWDELLRIEGNAHYGDLMERAIYNALFAAQSPDGRHVRYYSPLAGPRLYFDKDTYCCPCNYRRIIAELPGMVCYTLGDGVAVNLYTPSTARLPLTGGAVVTLTQETEYPSDGKVRITLGLDAAAEFTLHLRIPRWAKDATVAVNGESPKPLAPEPGMFHGMRATWHDGDVVEIVFPMALRLVRGHTAQAGRAAVMYGPQVFCLNPDLNPSLDGEDLRLITIDPATLSGPVPDSSVRPGGLACTVKAWRTTGWYPFAKHDWELTLSEFPDPGGQVTYLHLPNPEDPALVDDELMEGSP